MAFGALLKDVYGNPWITPDSTPMSLANKLVYDYSSSYSAEVQIPVNTAAPYMVCAHSNTSNCMFWLRRADGSFYFNMQRNEGYIGVVTVYIFTFVIPQPLPRMGIAIWNSSGQCILTNETKVMTPPVAYGTPGVLDDSGGLVVRDLAGKWAIVPQMTGLQVGVINTGGGVRPYSSPMHTCAYYNGSTTHINSTTKNPPGDIVQNQGYTSTYDVIYAMDVSKY
ncbi:hypothetical protein P0E69_09740 [Chimaeribacter arupi]|uniref:hypothetical protein n=1 Tax=Chimaeribacter arupi TaxID=2060066 RepID=UPI0027120CF2|nr:hypothetical protein [Chimaeribacter arupi]WKZ94124.1 hypothetical protein P0E69_09740 [Chimaeribacter arupi]